MAKEIQEPTPEQIGAFALEDVMERLRGGRTVAIGRAYRRRRMIDILHDAKVLSGDEHKALHTYRHNADLADRSPLRDSIASLMMIRGSGEEPSIVLLNAVRVRDDCERAAGSLAPMLRAVVVDDLSLSRWVISQGGGGEVARRNGRGTVVQALKRPLAIAQMEIQIAAQRVQAELDVRGAGR